MVALSCVTHTQNITLNFISKMSTHHLVTGCLPPVLFSSAVHCFSTAAATLFSVFRLLLLRRLLLLLLYFLLLLLPFCFPSLNGSVIVTSHVAQRTARGKINIGEGCFMLMAAAAAVQCYGIWHIHTTCTSGEQRFIHIAMFALVGYIDL